MHAIRLITRRVEKPWGRRDLLPAFGDAGPDEEPIGEIWFEDPRGGQPPLLVKYLFTSEKLSVQVHPDDALARASGLASGKDEAWLVLDADPGATIGIGLVAPIDKAALRAAALDGSIEHMLDWRPAAAGDFYYSPAGTVHAIGPGLKLIEVQQNADVTYRLYDYGRPRALHLDEAIEAATPEPYRATFEPYQNAPGQTILSAGGKFVLERWAGARQLSLRASPADPNWAIMIAGGARIGDQALAPGSVWLVESQQTLHLDADADLLVAYVGGTVRD